MNAQRSIVGTLPRGRSALGGILLAVVLGAGCATTSEEIEELQAAQAQFAQAQRTPRIDEFASRSMQAAGENLRRAESLARDNGDLDEIEHYSFLAQRHVEIAQARLNRGLMQEEIESADQRRQELMLQAQRTRTERSRTRATEAERRAEEAEAQLALTEQQLEQTREAARGLAEEIQELKVQEEERGTVFTLSDVVFDVDSDELTEGGQRSVARIADTLKRYPEGQILIEGYTDSTGSEDYNQDLSERRAEAVKAEFVQGGVPEERIDTQGYGEQYPVATNDTPQGRQLNRRVQIVISDDNQPVQRRGS